MTGSRTRPSACLAARRLGVSDRGFAHSWGLEAAWQGGEVPDLRRAAAVRARRARAERARRAAAAECGASRSAPARSSSTRSPTLFLTNPVANRASRAQGRAFCHDLRPRVAVAGAGGAGRARRGKAPATPRRSSAPCWPRSACRSTSRSGCFCLYGTARGVLAAAVRLGIAGSYEAQRLQHDMRAAMLDASPIGAARSTSATWRRRRRCSICCRRRTIGCIRGCFSPEGGSPCLRPRFHHHPVRHTHGPEFPAAPGRSRDRDTPLRAGLRARAPSPSASAARSAAARPRCSSRSAARFATRHAIAVVTNDIFTKEDAEFLVRNEALRAGAHRRGRDRRLPAHRRSRRHQPEPRGARPADGAAPAGAAVRRERRRQPRRAIQPRARRLHDLRDRRVGRRQDSAQGRARASRSRICSSSTRPISRRSSAPISA